MVKSQLKIAIVGDVHDQWLDVDNWALEQLDVDLVLFVGDFGNESIEIVRAIANLKQPKAVILGNHDAWFTIRRKKNSSQNSSQNDGVTTQLELLGNNHVGFGFCDFDELGISVVGARPFSWGGQKWKNSDFYGERYGVRSFDDSVALILTAVQKCAHETIILLGHNGPSGLGVQPWDICGIDWQQSGGDYGDPDLADVISKTRNFKQIALVAFGHMHHHVKTHPERRRTSVLKDSNGIVYVNAASVPRIVENLGHNFTLVNLELHQVRQVSLVWVDANSAKITTEITFCHDREI